MKNLSMPGDAWDPINSVFIRQYSSVGDLDHTPDIPYEFVIPASAPPAFDLVGLYIPRQTPTLIVTLHGSLDRSKFSLPRFEWRNTLAQVNAAQLYLADTTLSLSDDMALSWYCGNQTQNLIEDLTTLISDLAQAGGYSTVIITGSSGGGFASLAISRRIPESIAVCFSPQTNIGRYYKTAVDKFISVAFPENPPPSTDPSNWNERFNLIKLYGSTPARNYIRFVQNSLDTYHYNNHYTPFAEAHDIAPATGGISASGREEFILVKQREGHHPPQTHTFLHHVLDASKVFKGNVVTMRNV